MSNENDPTQALEAASDLVTLIECIADAFQGSTDFARISERARLLGDALTTYHAPAWTEELKRRVEEVQSGEAETVPIEEVFEQLGYERKELDPVSLNEGFCHDIRDRLTGVTGILGVYVRVLNGDVINGGDVSVEFFCEQDDPGGPVEIAVSAAMTELRSDVPKMRFVSSLRAWPKSEVLESVVAGKE
jgi:hypothetical protein